jgi:Alpha/beta hydrolase family
MPELELSHGTMHYRDEGSGPVVVLIHGLLVNRTVWDPLLGELSSSARCIVPDLPLGSHRTAMNEDADLSPGGLASLIAELLGRLELTDVTLVGNETGALCASSSAPSTRPGSDGSCLQTATPSSTSRRRSCGRSYGRWAESRAWSRRSICSDVIPTCGARR